MTSITVYQADSLGFFLYPTEAFELPLQPEEFNVPFGAHRKAPPVAPSGFVARATAQDVWEVVEDHRRDILFYVKEPATGEKEAYLEQYLMGAVVEIGGKAVSYDGGGAIPDWLTADAPTSQVALLT